MISPTDGVPPGAWSKVESIQYNKWDQFFRGEIKQVAQNIYIYIYIYIYGNSYVIFSFFFFGFPSNNTLFGLENFNDP